MTRLLKSSFVWQFVAGFAVGAIGIVTLAPADAAASPVSAPTHLSR